MTLTPLYEYISNYLQATISLYNAIGALVLQYPKNTAFDFFLSSPTLFTNLCTTNSLGYPVFSFINGDICFIHFPIPQKVDGKTIIIGPFRMLFITDTLHARYTYCLDDFTQPQQLSIPNVNPIHALQMALLLFNCCHDTSLTATDCWQKNFDTAPLSETVQKTTTETIFSNRENQKMHNSYTQELRLLQCIEEGNVELLQEIWRKPISGTLGTTAKDPIRNGKNMSIYNITASGRAAIRAGVSAEYIFSLTDSYSQQVEDLGNMLLLQPLVENAELHFAQLAAEAREAKQSSDIEVPLIRHCKDYIFKHLHDPLTVAQIAEKLHTHPNYLNTLFRKSEGQSLYQYILAEKMNLAKNLLTYSNYSYMEIAHYLGFLSQSHLGTRFKAHTGMTLKQYRDTHKKDSF